MDLKGKRIGFGLTGSHCTYEQVFPQIEKLMELGAEVVQSFLIRFKRRIQSSVMQRIIWNELNKLLEKNLSRQCLKQNRLDRKRHWIA